MEAYRKIYIKSEADLPKETTYGLIVHEFSPNEGIWICNFIKSPPLIIGESKISTGNESYLLNHCDWYFQPIEIADSDIEAWAKNSASLLILLGGERHQLSDRLIDLAEYCMKAGAKAALNGEIKHIK